MYLIVTEPDKVHSVWKPIQTGYFCVYSATAAVRPGCTSPDLSEYRSRVWVNSATLPKGNREVSVRFNGVSLVEQPKQDWKRWYEIGYVRKVIAREI